MIRLKNRQLLFIGVLLLVIAYLLIRWSLSSDNPSSDYLSSGNPKNHACRALPSDSRVEMCPFCSETSFKSVSVYLDKFDAINTFLGGSLKNYIETSRGCKLRGDVECIFNADNPQSDAMLKFGYAYNFHEDSPSRNCFPQILVLLTSEAENPGYDHGYKPYVEVFVDYHPESQVKILYLCWKIDALLKLAESGPPNPVGRSGVAMFVSNCGYKERVDYLDKLARFIKIDSYGACLHNMDIPPGRTYDNSVQAKENWEAEMVKLSSKYRMVIAYENSNSLDYLSEKLFNVLSAGAIPVFRGTSSVYRQLPDRHNIINIDDFETPEELALYMARVETDDELFRRHATLDHDKLLRLRKDLCSKSYIPEPCQICQVVLDLKKSSVGNATRPCNCLNKP